jgi:hypothetical protein
MDQLTHELPFAKKLMWKFPERGITGEIRISWLHATLNVAGARAESTLGPQGLQLSLGCVDQDPVEEECVTLAGKPEESVLCE